MLNYPLMDVMKTNLFYTLITLFLAFSGFAQEEYLANLNIHGRYESMTINNNEEVWIATATGNTYYTKGWGELWHMGPLGDPDPMAYSGNNNFDRINFLSDDILLVSGWIGKGLKDIVYRSVDGGKNWKTLKFGESSWIDAFYTDSKGNVWMSGSSQLIYYSSDYGKTWKEYDKVEKEGNLRFNTIHFSKDNSVGLFGSFWNVIYETKDNCQTWTKLPTPLVQKKYERLSNESRPDIRKIRVMDNFYVVDQQGRIFYTQRDSIDWVPMKDVTDFEITESGNLFLLKKGSEIELVNDQLDTLWTRKIKYGSPTNFIAVKNEALYIKTYEELIKLNEKGEWRTPLLTDDYDIPQPYETLDYHDERYGYDGRLILQYDTRKKKWFRLKEVDFIIGGMIVLDDQIILTNVGLDSHFSFLPEDKTLIEYNFPARVLDLQKNKVESFTVEDGSQGCFHFVTNTRTYKRKGDVFKVDKNDNEHFKKMPSEISTARIDTLLSTLDQSRDDSVSLVDFQISEKDIQNYKEFIREKVKEIRKKGYDRFDYDSPYFFPGENADFDFYIVMADSLDQIPVEIIRKAISHPSGIWSTTMNWRRVTFLFEDGRELVVNNGELRPNYLYLPWKVDFNGYQFKTTSYAFASQLNELTVGELIQKDYQDKSYLIFQIINYLYLQEFAEQ